MEESVRGIYSAVEFTAEFFFNILLAYFVDKE